MYPILFITAGKQLSDGPPSPPGFSCFRAAAALLSAQTHRRDGDTDFCSKLVLHCSIKSVFKKKCPLTPLSANTGPTRGNSRGIHLISHFLYRSSSHIYAEHDVCMICFSFLWDTNPFECLEIFFLFFFVFIFQRKAVREWSKTCTVYFSFCRLHRHI